MAGIHDGHRGRMRNRYINEGLNNFAEHEVLELLLYYSVPQKDTNPIAHRLLDEFGSLNQVLSADILQLTKIDGVSENSAVLISLVSDIISKAKVTGVAGATLDSARKLCNFCTDLFFNETVECSKVICLDSRLKVVGWQEISRGTQIKTDFKVRDVVKTAFKFNCDIIVLAHNHPSGHCQPSDLDLSTTTLVKNTLSTLGINVLDHVIVGADRTISLKNEGFMFEL